MTILAALDLGEKSGAVFSEALKLAAMKQTKLWLLHVAEPEPDFVGYGVGPDSVREYMAKQYHKEHQAIQAFSAQAREQGVEADALLVQGSYAETIKSEAEKLKAEVVVIGTQGKGMAKRFLLGSVSEQVIRHSEVPVLVIPVR